MLSSKEIVCPNNLLDLAHKKKGIEVAVVNAGKPLPMLSIQDAVNKVYDIDVAAIRNLSNLAGKINTEEKISFPGNVEITG